MFTIIIHSMNDWDCLIINLYIRIERERERVCTHTYTVACMQNHAVDGDMYVHAGTWMAARIKAPSHPCRVAVRVLACVPSSKYASPPLLAHAFPMTSTPRPVTKFFYVRSPRAAPLIRWWWMRGWRPPRVR